MPERKTTKYPIIKWGFVSDSYRDYATLLVERNNYLHYIKILIRGTDELGAVTFEYGDENVLIKETVTNRGFLQSDVVHYTIILKKETENP